MSTLRNCSLEKKFKLELFVFLALIFLGTGFFVLAEDQGNNIFADADQDGLSNSEEKLYGTDAFNKDSDGDGYSDGVEVESGYDPLKRAPGDKILVGGLRSDQSASVQAALGDSTRENLTEKASNEIALVLQNAKAGDKVNMDDINDSVQKLLGETSEEIQLPEVSLEDIKIKKGPSKKLSDKDRKKQERDDALEYLTVLSYIVANNTPKSFHTEDDLANYFEEISTESISALASGDQKFVEQISQKGEATLSEIKGIEVPEAMVDVHVKALKMALYASKLGKELNTPNDDPIAKIASLSRAQGFIASVMSLAQELQQRMTDMDIQTIPIDL